MNMAMRVRGENCAGPWVQKAQRQRRKVRGARGSFFGGRGRELKVSVV